MSSDTGEAGTVKIVSRGVRPLLVVLIAAVLLVLVVLVLLMGQMSRNADDQQMRDLYSYCGNVYGPGTIAFEHCLAYGG